MNLGVVVTTNKDSFANEHLVPYEDLVPCTTAFIDTRTPGSKQKENFTIIGPGVSENPDQHVHITRAHGFNIGGARQPPNCVNSQHSHDTAEVFVVHSGSWAFTSGEHGTDGRVILHPGDTISIPTQCFRGFENVGDSSGFLFAVLGGDDPGRVTWAPHVFDQAQSYGLVLLENGALVDTAKGEVIPTDIAPMTKTSAETIATLRTIDDAALEACVLRASNIEHAPKLEHFGSGVDERLLIGSSNVYTAPLAWSHGFQLRHLALEAGASTPLYQQNQEEVLLVQSGKLTIDVSGHELCLGPGDVFTAPIDGKRCLKNDTEERCEIYVVHGGESPQCSTTNRSN